MQIKKEFLFNPAQKTGIDLIGVVDLKLFEKMREKLLPFENIPMAFFKGKLSDRFDIKKEWSEAKGIISFALSYGNSLNLNAFDKHHLYISKASYGKDYHEVLKAKAEKFMEEFCKTYPCKYKIFVDTGLLSDRALAYCAGLGFYGKNNFIINEKFGSFIFLGHILLNIDVENTVEPVGEKCGQCERCLKACPQEACKNGHPVDFEKCISYLTQKGRPYFKTNYIYGCDICQDVCPFNKHAPKDLHEEFLPQIENIRLDFNDFEEMGEEAFRQRFGDSALSWRGLKTLKKNAQTVKTRS